MPTPLERTVLHHIEVIANAIDFAVTAPQRMDFLRQAASASFSAATAYSQQQHSHAGSEQVCHAQAVDCNAWVLSHQGRRHRKCCRRWSKLHHFGLAKITALFYMTLFNVCGRALSKCSYTSQAALCTAFANSGCSASAG